MHGAHLDDGPQSLVLAQAPVVRQHPVHIGVPVVVVDLVPLRLRTPAPTLTASTALGRCFLQGSVEAASVTPPR